MSPDKADLDDGFVRIANILLAAFPLFDLTASARAVLDLVVLSAWGQATRSPGYLCRRSAVEIVKLLDGHFSEPRIYHAIRELRTKHLLTPDRKTLTINPQCIAHLSIQDKATLGLIIESHNAERVFSKPRIPVFIDATVENDRKTVENDSLRIKDARKRVKRVKALTSSSVFNSHSFAQSVPKSDDDEVKIEKQKAKLQLCTALALRLNKLSGRPIAEIQNEISGLYGKTDDEIIAGAKRVLRALQLGAVRKVFNARSLIAAAISNPDDYPPELPLGELLENEIEKKPAVTEPDELAFRKASAEHNAKLLGKP